MHKKKNILELTRCTAAEYRQARKLPLCLLADNVRSMHNIGSFFRTADAFRLQRIILGGISGCPPHPEITKTALGAEESVEWCHVDDPVETTLALQAEGWKICVLEQTHNSVPLQDFIPSDKERYILVCGNEVEGVNQQIADIADIVLEIPQCGVKHSLNVSISTGIALWHFFSHLNPLTSTL